MPRRIRGARLAGGWSGKAPEAQLRDGPAGNRPDAGPNPIRDYLARHGEGPGIQKWQHYPDIYHRHLAKFVGRNPVVAEVGIGSGGSLQMWREYFGAGCQVHGIDVDPAGISDSGAGITVHIGDQADHAMWERFRAAVPQLDILVDDGGHTPQQQMITLEEMLPHLRPGGVYICEDVHGAANRFAEFAFALCDGLNAGEIESETGVDRIAATPFQSAIHSIHAYPFVVLIEKREAAMPAFAAPLRGTLWRP
ncbi:MAG: class I SAM-dependent methyltransferase [Proteobacteria bacterium]|nr:class I SAM-dependent methyltransferase [Pseudomonadota bacterium]